jgi:predicted 3-demethylubiquinone-9 3-methyltransferase (glyoxalase superfamily)
MKQRIIPFLWYEVDNAVNIARYYRDIFGAKHVHIHDEESLDNTPSGSVQVVTIDIFDTTFQFMSAGKHDSFNDAISFMIKCKDQAEIDHYWDKLSSIPEAEQCGWCRDKYNVRWQIVPQNLNQLIGSEAGMQKFLKMKKIIIADLENDKISK